MIDSVQGIFRAIGISNYTLSHMKELLSECEIVPHVVQLELHPHYQQQDLIQFCEVEISENFCN